MKEMRMFMDLSTPSAFSKLYLRMHWCVRLCMVTHVCMDMRFCVKAHGHQRAVSPRIVVPAWVYVYG